MDNNINNSTPSTTSTSSTNNKKKRTGRSKKQQYKARYNKPDMHQKSKEFRRLAKQSPPVCTSQVFNPLYCKLSDDNRLRRFLAAIKRCSSQNITIEAMCKEIYKLFPQYITKKDFNPRIFLDMCKHHPDVSEAWGYGQAGDELAKIMIKDRALELAIKSDNMQDIEIYNKIYGDGVRSEKDAEAISSTLPPSSNTFNFNLTQKE